MNLLLDSHVALWWLSGDESLGEDAAAEIERSDDVAVSVVTPWELGIKRAAGKLVYPDGLTEALVGAGFSMLPVSAAHAELAPMLPMHHRDPFDRMLVAQARLEALSIVTADAAITGYDVEVIDARR